MPSHSQAFSRLRYGWIILAVQLGTLFMTQSASARWPSAAPQLPPPDPGVFTAVTHVDTAQALVDACWNLGSNQAIVIAGGTYDLSDVVFPPGGVAGLTVGRWDASPISNIQIRGATGDPEDVVILGRGMDSAIVEYGFQIVTATDVLIADLSLGSVYYHAVAIEHLQGAERVRLYHTRLFDAGQQIVKGNPGASSGPADVTIEYSELFYTAGVTNHPEVGSCYTNAIDAVGGRRWIIRDNLIHDIYCQDGSLAGPSVLLWQGTSDSIVERNTFLNCSRGVSLGLSGSDHSGGIVRNNFFRWDPLAGYEVDIAIHTTAPNSKILHNTVLTHATYQPNGGSVGIEVRYSTATDVEVRNNLMDADVWLRDGASPTVSGNLGTADPTWFLEESRGDLHLLSSGADAIDQVTVLADCGEDFDGQKRPSGAGRADLGASELIVLFANGFELGSVSAWTRTLGGD